MVYRNNEPYNDLPLLPPPADIESAARAATLHHSQSGAGRIEGRGESHPESVYADQLDSPARGRLSSEIENIVTTQDALFRAAVEEPGRADPQTREVLRYRTALRHGFDTLQSRPIGIDLMLELCSMLHDEPAALRDQEPILIEDVAAQSCRLHATARSIS